MALTAALSVVVVVFVTGALTVMALTATLNVLTFPRLGRKRLPLPDSPPLVSLCIPARNEADVIAETVRSHLNQTYPHFEVLILDDHSDDGTADNARAAAAGDSRLRVLHGQPLPPGWMGKNWACQQMAEVARGDIIIFTDADVRWQRAALTALVEMMTRNQADLQTVWSTQTSVTPAERLTVPLMALVIGSYLPVVLTHYAPYPSTAAANGQCMAWRRSAYDRIGGHTAVSDNVLEDVTMARMVKRAGLRLRMADGNRQITCRMYTGWHSVRDGYAKNILAGYGNSVPLLALATVFHWLVFIFPLIWLLVGWSVPQFFPYPATPLALLVLGVGVRALTAAFTHQRLLDALFMPISALLMTRIAAQSVWWQWRYGGPVWKGRTPNGKVHKENTHQLLPFANREEG